MVGFNSWSQLTEIALILIVYMFIYFINFNVDKIFIQLNYKIKPFRDSNLLLQLNQQAMQPRTMQCKIWI